MRKYVIYSIQCLLLAMVIFVAARVKFSNEVSYPIDKGTTFARSVDAAVGEFEGPIVYPQIKSIYDALDEADDICITYSRFLQKNDISQEVEHAYSEYSISRDLGHTTVTNDEGVEDIWFSDDFYAVKDNDGDLVTHVRSVSQAGCNYDTSYFDKNINTILYVLEVLDNSEVGVTETSDYIVYNFSSNDTIIGDNLVKSTTDGQLNLTNYQVRFPTSDTLPYYVSISTFYKETSTGVSREILEYKFKVNTNPIIELPEGIER